MIDKLIAIYAKLFLSDEAYARFIGVQIGKGCSIGTRYFGTEPYLIKIGNRVQITNGVRFFTHGGSWVFREKYPDFDYFGKILIGNNVYIGNCAFIMPGVSIGDNVIIGANAVVTKSVPNESIVVGNPGRIVGTVSELESRIEKYNLNSKRLSNKEKKDYLLSLDDEYFVKK